MKVDIINYHKNINSGLININSSDGRISFNCVNINTDNKDVSIYDYFEVEDIYCIDGNHIDSNTCSIDGLYLITRPINNTLVLFRVNNDETELISNIDSDSNYMNINSCYHKLYKAGKINNANIYYCYTCGNYFLE